MPIKWTSELDAILLHGVFEECNISFGKPLCTKIAERVSAAGMECSAKAVENRLYSWKKKNVSSNTNFHSATNTPSKSSAATTPKSTPRPRAKATPRKKKAVSEEVLPSPTAARGKRNVNSKMNLEHDESSDKGDGEEYVEEEYVPMAKRVKQELVEEEEVASGDESVEDKFECSI